MLNSGKMDFCLLLKVFFTHTPLYTLTMNTNPIEKNTEEFKRFFHSTKNFSYSHKTTMMMMMRVEKSGEEWRNMHALEYCRECDWHHFSSC